MFESREKKCRVNFCLGVLSLTWLKMVFHNCVPAYLLGKKLSKNEERKKKSVCLSSRVRKHGAGRFSLQLCICFPSIFHFQKLWGQRSKSSWELFNSPAPYQPLNLCQKLGLKDASRLEPLRHFASQQQALGSEVHQHVPDDLPQVHAADHLLVPESKSKASELEQDPRGTFAQTPDDFECGSVDDFSGCRTKVSCDLTSAPPCSDVNNAIRVLHRTFTFTVGLCSATISVAFAKKKQSSIDLGSMSIVADTSIAFSLHLNSLLTWFCAFHRKDAWFRVWKKCSGLKPWKYGTYFSLCCYVYSNLLFKAYSPVSQHKLLFTLTVQEDNQRNIKGF